MTSHCSKATFPSEAAAQQRLHQIWRAPPRMYTPTGYYQCRVCGRWHLTSKSIKPWSRARNPKRGGR